MDLLVDQAEVIEDCLVNLDPEDLLVILVSLVNRDREDSQVFRECLDLLVHLDQREIEVMLVIQVYLVKEGRVHLAP